MNRNLIFLLFALTGVFFFALTGIMIAEQNMIGMLLAIIAAILVIGVGFMVKKKFRLQDEKHS